MLGWWKEVSHLPCRVSVCVKAKVFITKSTFYVKKIVIRALDHIDLASSSRCTFHHNRASEYSGGCWHHSSSQLPGRG